jgi:3-hydroxyisobutyrate dehydrogenase-like beta-hydroxyacid dehydrogenase
MNMNIAFIGLGNMGAPMARNLLKAGHALQPFDLNADAGARCRTPARRWPRRRATRRPARRW